MIEFLTSQFGASVVLALVVFGTMMGAVAYCIYFERKVSAWIHDRHGPNRVGPYGLFQPLADGGKMLLKEDFIPAQADKALFVLAPALAFVVAFIGFAAIPWGGQLAIGDKVLNIQVASIDIGLLYLVGVGSMGVYGVVLGAWSSNNKYAQYGGTRAAAQMLSYEIPMGMCILVIVVTMGTLRLEHIIPPQTEYWLGVIPKWNLFLHPVAFLIFFITMLAETNRTPFDLAEAEQELVGGFHTEYSALKFGMFFLGEYAHMITGSAFAAVLFLGGWHLPWFAWTQPDATAWYCVIAKMGVMSAKIVGFLFVMMWIRWTLPRMRFDQLMRIAWKGLVPMTLGLFVLAVLLVYFGRHRDPLWTLGGNAFLVIATMWAASRPGAKVTGAPTRRRPVPTETIATPSLGN